MRTHVLDQMELEHYEKLHQFLDGCTKDSESQIYVDSNGGSLPYFESISDRLNRMVSEGYELTLRIMTANSAAFHLAYEFKGPLELERNCEGVVHVSAQGDSGVFFQGGKMKARTESVVIKGRFARDINFEPYDYPFLTESEKETYLNGGDVFLNTERMLEIFANRSKRNTIEPVPEIAALHQLESVPTESNSVSQNGSRESTEVTEKI